MRWLRHGHPAGEYSGKTLAVVRHTDRGATLVAVGDDAARAQDRDVHLVDGFGHPRVVVGNFDAASLALNHFVRRAKNVSTLVKPRIVMHVVDTLKGGVSDPEARALADLGRRAGGGTVFLHYGPRELTDDEALAFTDLRPL